MKAWAHGAAACVLVACSSAPIKTHYYTLHPLATDAQSGSTKQGQRDGWHAGSARESVQKLPQMGAVGIGPILLPGMLDRKEVISYSAGQQVLLQSHRYWAESLKTLISRVVSENVQGLSDYQNIWAHPWGSRLRPEKNIEITISELGGTLGGDIRLTAKWRLLANSGRSVIAHSRVQLKVSAKAKTYESYTAAINDLINQLSGHIAGSLQTFGLPGLDS